MSRALLRSALELRSPVTRLPPAFLLPIQARWISSSSPSSCPQTRADTLATPSAQSPLPPSPPLPSSSPASLKPSSAQQTPAAVHARTTTASSYSNSAAAAAAAAATAAASPAAPAARPRPTSSRTAPAEPTPQPATAGPIPDSVRQLLPLLRSQPAHYITVHINSRPYLVTPGDSIRLPFLMPGVSPGDVLRLNRASVLGSRDFTLRPTNPSARKPGSNEVAYIDERLFECRATVVGVDSEPMRIKEKTKRRNRRVRTVKSKHRYTVLRVSELKIRNPAEIEE